MLAVLAYSLAAPLAMYGTQVYPELPAALAVTVAVAALTGPLRRGGLVVLGLALVALPWLSVKYAPVVARARRCSRSWQLARQRSAPATAFALGGGLALAGVVYLGAAPGLVRRLDRVRRGIHFVGGETDVVGTSPELRGPRGAARRSARRPRLRARRVAARVPPDRPGLRRARCAGARRAGRSSPPASPPAG